MSGRHTPISDDANAKRRECLVRLVMACRGKTLEINRASGLSMIIDGAYADTDGTWLDGYGVAAFGHEEATGNGVNVKAASYETQMRDMLPDDWNPDAMPTADELMSEQDGRRWLLYPLIEACMGRRLLVGGCDRWVISEVFPGVGASTMLIRGMSPDGTAAQEWMAVDPLQYESQIRSLYDGER